MAPSNPTMLHILQLIVAPMFALGALYVAPLSVGLILALLHYLSSDGLFVSEVPRIRTVTRASQCSCILVRIQPTSKL